MGIFGLKINHLATLLGSPRLNITFFLNERSISPPPKSGKTTASLATNGAVFQRGPEINLFEKGRSVVVCVINLFEKDVSLLSACQLQPFKNRFSCDVRNRTT
jgi:hypothetical protein